VPVRNALTVAKGHKRVVPCQSGWFQASNGAVCDPVMMFMAG